MKKSVFYGVAITLILISWIFLVAGGEGAQPTKFLGILVVCLLFNDLLLTIELGWNFWDMLLLLVVTAICAGGIGLVAAETSASIINPGANKNIIPTYVLGIRWISLIWPVAVLAIGAVHRQVKSQEEPKAEKPIVDMVD